MLRYVTVSLSTFSISVGTEAEPYLVSVRYKRRAVEDVGDSILRVLELSAELGDLPNVLTGAVEQPQTVGAVLSLQDAQPLNDNNGVFHRPIFKRTRATGLQISYVQGGYWNMNTSPVLVQVAWLTGYYFLVSLKPLRLTPSKKINDKTLPTSSTRAY